MLPHHRTIGVAAGIVSISQFVVTLQVLPVYSMFSGRHLELPAENDVAH
jgi:hypothetical protein